MIDNELLSKKKNLLLFDTIIFGIGTFSTKLIVYILLPVYTIGMSIDEFGRSDYLMSTIFILSPLFTLEVNSALLRFMMSKKLKNADVLKNVFALLIFLLSILLLVLNFNFIELNELKLYYFFSITFFTLMQFLTTYAKSIGKTKKIMMKSLIQSIILLTTSYIFILVLHRGIKGYFEGVILSYFSAVFYLWIILKPIKASKEGKINFQLIKEIIVYSIPLLINTLSWSVNSYFDRYVLKKFSGYSSVAIYSVSYKIPLLIATLSSVFIQAWVLDVIREFENNKNANYIDAVLKRFVMLIIIGASFIIIFGKQIIVFLVDREYYSASAYIPILVFAVVVNCINDFYGAIFIAAKRVNILSLTSVLGAVMNIILNIILIPRYDIYGACSATAIAFLIVLIGRTIGLKKVIGISLNINKMFIGLTIFFSELYLLILLNENIFVYVIYFIILLCVFWDEIKDTLVLICRYFIKFTRDIE